LIQISFMLYFRVAPFLEHVGGTSKVYGAARKGATQNLNIKLLSFIELKLVNVLKLLCYCSRKYTLVLLCYCSRKYTTYDTTILLLPRLYVRETFKHSTKSDIGLLHRTGHGNIPASLGHTERVLNLGSTGGGNHKRVEMADHRFVNVAGIEIDELVIGTHDTVIESRAIFKDQFVVDETSRMVSAKGGWGGNFHHDLFAAKKPRLGFIGTVHQSHCQTDVISIDGDSAMSDVQKAIDVERPKSSRAVGKIELHDAGR